MATEIPKNVARNVIDVISPIVDEINAGGLQVDTSGSNESDYGHAMRGLVQSAFGNTSLNDQEQLENLKKTAQVFMDKYGEKIKQFLRPELLEALEINDRKEDI